MSRDRAHMSAIGREGGHSRGRTRQSQIGQGQGISSGSDMERGSFIGHGSDREAALGTPSNLGRSEQRNEPPVNRGESGSFGGRGQF